MDQLTKSISIKDKPKASPEMLWGLRGYGGHPWTEGNSEQMWVAGTKDEETGKSLL